MDEVDGYILRCNNDLNALEKLYRLFKRDVFAIGFFIVRDRGFAEDVVSETFIRLSQISVKYRPKGKGKVYVLKIASNVAKEIKHKNNKVITVDDTVLERIPSDFQISEARIMTEELMKILNEKEMEVINLRYFSDLTYKEISEVLKVSESTVKWRHESALTKMREKIGDEKDE